MAFVNSGTAEKALLREQLADMIFKNVHSIANLEFDSREIAREKELIRKSLKNKSIQEMARELQETSEVVTSK